MPEAVPDTLAAHYTTVIKALIDGRVVPFFGAGVNLWGRTPQAQWRQGAELPSGSDLSLYLASEFSYPEQDKTDLLRVAQYVTVMNGSGPLYEKLHDLFNVDYLLTPVHEFFAELPSTLRTKGYPPRYQLIVTTNYDDVLERAFQNVREPFDVVTYIADGEESGRFIHRAPDGEEYLIERPNEYTALPIEAATRILQRPVILKIHGAVHRGEMERDSYVVTEDHYIDYLSRSDISNLMPKALVAKLKGSHFLFLGYSLRDWNLRVILRRLWGERKLTYKSWAIQLNPQSLEEQFWRKRDVDIFSLPMETYIIALRSRLHALPPPG